MFNRITRWWRLEGKYFNRNIKYGISNLIKWFPIIWKDRDWDQAYIWDILKFKLEKQSRHIKKYGHHVNADHDARNMMICANLIDKIRDESYQMEYMGYYDCNFDFVPSKEEGYLEMVSTENWEKFDEYFAKYPRIYKQILESKKTAYCIDTKRGIALNIGHINHQRALKLLFKIMENEIETWWD